MIKIKNRGKLAIFAITTFFSIQTFAAYNEMHKAVDDNNIKVVEELLKTKPTLLQELDDNGNTPLHKAINDNKNASLQSFMKFKRSINTQIVNQEGDTPLVYAIKNKKYNSIIFMLDNGINPFYKDKFEKNSLDYVKESGDITTKQLYNEFYSRNRDKIKRLQESYSQPVDLSLFSNEEEKIIAKKETPKISKVQDLLIGNSRAKNLAMIGSAEPESLEEVKPVGVLAPKPIEATIKVDPDKIRELAAKLDKLKIDQNLLATLQDKVKILQEENAFLKKKLEFKQSTGINELSPLEENVVKSQYAGIYEQQLIYGDTASDNNQMPNFEGNQVIPSNLEDNLPAVGDVIDYKNDAVKNLSNIEQEFPVLSSTINKAIKKDIESPIVVLPIDKLPENQVVVNSIEKNKQPIEVKTDSTLKTPVSTPIVKVQSEPSAIKKENSLKIVKDKEDFKKEFSEKMSSDSSVAFIMIILILGIICFVAYGFISYKDYKNRKNKIDVTKKVVDNEIEIKVTNKDKI